MRLNIVPSPRATIHGIPDHLTDDSTMTAELADALERREPFSMVLHGRGECRIINAALDITSPVLRELPRVRRKKENVLTVIATASRWAAGD